MLRALVLALLLLPSLASAEVGRPILFTLGAAKLPGVAFDAVAISKIAPQLGSYGDLEPAARAALGSNVTTLVLHSVSIGTFWGAALSGAEPAQRIFVPALVNGLSDLTIAVMGVVTGADLLVRVRSAGIGRTEPGIGALWSGWVNVVMGGFGAIWFLPMLGATVGSAEAALSGPAGPPRTVQVAVQVGPGRLALVGRF